jgi:uncharacterized membrane protein YraQ (UPF0718 family)
MLVLISLLADRQKTRQALGIALKRFLDVLPAFLMMLVLMSLALGLIPERLMMTLFGRDNRWLAMSSAVVIGSVSVVPGFIAFPLCGLLLEKGALYMVLSAFSMTLMLVGAVTFPLERKYLGTRLALARNAVSLLIALAVAVATGFFFGELP